MYALAGAVADGTLDLAPLRDGSLPPAEMKRALLALRGVGPYAAHTLLMLAGHYGEVAIDSAMRAFLARAYYGGRTPTDKEMQAHYADWGAWQYLAYWFDMTAPDGVRVPPGGGG